MTEHVSTVDFRHLLDDLADDYPFPPHEALLVEMIANALDAKASRIFIRTDASTRTLEIMDNGSGMNLQDFIDYHNFAVSRKRKGVGIGFAGLGAKLGVKLSDIVITETRTPTYRGASKWHFRGDRLVWSEIGDRTLPGNGTKVTYRLPADSILLDPGEVVRLIQTHYTPLLDQHFARIYQRPGIYPRGVIFSVNGSDVGGKPFVFANRIRDRYEFTITRGRKAEPIGLGYLMLAYDPVPEELHGIAICTYGKVIKRDLFRKFPKDAECITGLVEVPSLVQYLQTNKADFRRDASGRYAQFYREMQRIVGEWLARLGETLERSEVSKETEHLEKVIRSVLKELPEFADFFGASARQPVSIPSQGGMPATTIPGGQLTRGDEPGGGGGTGIPVSPGPGDGAGLTSAERGDQRATPRPKPISAGPKVRFENGGPERRLGWVDGNTVVINTGHPAFTKAEAERLKFYHNLLSIVYGLLDERQGDDELKPLEVVDRFFAAWGKA
jgi:hypothetical protein